MEKAYTYKVAGNVSAARFLRRIEHKVIVKRPQVELALAYADRVANRVGRQSHFLSTEEKAIRAQMVEQLRALNRRGVDR